MFNREGFLVSVLNKVGVGFPLPEKDYGDVCDIYIPNHPSGDPYYNVTDRIDVFVLAHSLGWFVKALLVRDVKVSWICSVLFEVIELAFAHLLPNFRYVVDSINFPPSVLNRECWWDSWILDVFGCNMLGIHSADFVITQLGWKKFNFISNAFKSKKINFAFLFSASLLVVLISLIDLNFFFLKYVFWIPTTHWLCHIRTYMFALISAPASMEMYQWCVSSKSPNRLSFFTACPSAVVGIIALVSEILLVVLFRGNMFASSPATPLGTVLLIVTTVYFAIYSFLKIPSARRVDNK
jgi:phosphatidylserine synthase 2